jgi:hypothetical protein
VFCFVREEAYLNLAYSPNEPKELNQALTAIQKLLDTLFPNKKELIRPNMSLTLLSLKSLSCLAKWMDFVKK